MKMKSINLPKKHLGKRGFTLIELIIVIVIIAILAAIAIPAMSGFKKDAEEAAAIANTRTIYTAVSATLAKIDGDYSFMARDLNPINSGVQDPRFEAVVIDHLGTGFPGRVGWKVGNVGGKKAITVIQWQKDSSSPICTYTIETGIFEYK